MRGSVITFLHEPALLAVLAVRVPLTDGRALALLLEWRAQSGVGSERTKGKKLLVARPWMLAAGRKAQECSNEAEPEIAVGLALQNYDIPCENLPKSQRLQPCVSDLNQSASYEDSHIILISQIQLPRKVVALNKRSKEAESAFLGIYKQLIEAPGHN
ncbi:hypothetical protein PAMP_022650 [Pampus punctatissimus]